MTQRKIIGNQSADQKVLARVPMCSKNDINLAVAGAQKAQESWRNIPVSERMRVMLKYQELLKKNMEALAAVVAEENGKTFEDAKAMFFAALRWWNTPVPFPLC